MGDDLDMCGHGRFSTCHICNPNVGMVSVPAEKIAALREALDFFAEAENRVDLAARAVVDAAAESERN